jgi:hypothetical protein
VNDAVAYWALRRVFALSAATIHPQAISVSATIANAVQTLHNVLCVDDISSLRELSFTIVYQPFTYRLPTVAWSSMEKLNKV